MIDLNLSTFEKAVAKHRAGDLPEAYRLYLQSSREDSTNVETWMNLGEALKASSKFTLSEICFRKALALRNDPAIHHQLGEILRENLKFIEAEKHLLVTIKAFPNDARAWYNLSLVYMSMNRIDEAIKANETSIRLEPNLADIKIQRSLLHFYSGEYQKAFDLYEYRLQTTHGKLAMSEPPWDGKNLRGKTLHVYCEQGFGDVIQFIRFLPLLPKDGKIVVTVPKELRRLIENSFPLSHVEYYNHGLSNPPCDYSISIGSVPRFTLKGKPSGHPYLVAPSTDKKILRPRGVKKAMGICWAGNPKHQHDKLRSSTIDAFINTLAKSGVELYSLQYAPQDIDPAFLGPMGLVQDLTPLISDFADTAALVQQMDCVVSVDTSIVHLCGALGIKCHVLIPYGAVDWRWQYQRSDSDWYSSLTLHRQEKDESWEDVLKRVAEVI